MAKGENIFRRKDGRWEARYRKAYTAEGKIHYGYCYGKTYREAKEKVERCKALQMECTAAGKAVPQRDMIFYCDEWLRHSKNRLKDSTYVKYSSVLNRYLKPWFGNRRPQEITTGRVDAFSEHLLQMRGLSPKTVRDILTLLRSVLKFTARELGVAMFNVEIIYPKAVKKERRVLSREEEERLIRYLLCDLDDCKFGILLALMTGLRIGELCALQWRSISLQEKTIHIDSTLQRLQILGKNGGGKTKIAISHPKSDHAVRTIPLTGSLTALCIRQIRRMEDYVLTGSSAYMEPRTLQYRLKKYAAECGIADIHFHTLRHTFATRCVEVGFEIKSLSEILGHSNTKITLDCYVHSSMALKRDNMEKLAAIGF